ncbi:hypothetical protein [Rhodococcus maanshanensis]|uniref:Uncharacterized protein n=1 Tax=Rhodococcus maanshanensis TaxID=183556 RepID=A0A1H7RZC4_9NOCA|nr:hypothetical protein [Rhodococcus maanshanensis]SEL65681.1 hypothetical protein SAMN05444583_11292 [Rhodococcus maanshanensis]
MLSASNLKSLDEAGLKFIVGSRVTKVRSFRGRIGDLLKITPDVPADKASSRLTIVTPLPPRFI